jgi:hypothetical protein
MQFLDDGACGEDGNEDDDQDGGDVTNVFHSNIISITLQISEKKPFSNFTKYGDFENGFSLLIWM